MLANRFSSLIPAGEIYAHPPLFIALVALAWKTFGVSRVVSHAVVLPCLPITMSATYLLGTWAGDRLVGLFAAVLFGVTAVTLCEVGQIYFDLPVAAIAACGLVAWVSDWPLLSGALFVLASWTKVPAASVVVGLALVTAFDHRRRRSARHWVGIAIALAAVAAWLLYHHAATGWWIASDRAPFSHNENDASAWLGRAGVLLRVFVDRCRFAVSAVAVAAVAAMVVRRDSPPWRQIAVLGLTIAMPLVLFVSSTFQIRYMLLVLPSFFVLSLSLARRTIPTRAFVLLGSALVAAFVTTWHPREGPTSKDTYEWAQRADYSYLDMIRIGQRAASYLEKNAAAAEIYGSFPEHYELGDPDMGYVTRALDVRPCTHFWRDRAQQILVVHQYAPEQRACHLVAQKTGAQRIARFQSNDKWLELWQVPVVGAAPSRAPSP